MIPIEWKKIVLGEYLDVIRGASPRPKGDPRYFGGSIPWISIKDINAEKGKYLTKTAEGVTPAGAEKSRLIPIDGLILSNSASVCIPKILKTQGCIHDGFVTFPDLNNNFSVDYFYHLFNWMRPSVIQANKQGVTQVNLNIEIVKAFKLPIPSIHEQKQIATKLNELLAQVDTIKNRLDAIPTTLKHFRQSVLAAAVSGRLTEEWRKKLSIPELLLKNVGEYIELIYGKSLPAKRRTGEGFPVYGSNGEVGRHKDYLVDGPFIIIGRKGSNGIVTWSDESGWPIDTSYYVKINKEKLQLKFSFYMLQTLGLTELNRSTAIPGLNRDDAYACEFLLPGLDEQTEIVSRVEQLFTIADQIELRVKDAQTRVNNLTQSILAKAFRGELTTEWREQNPDLISGKNSAEVLLAKIKSEKEALKPTKKVKRKKTA